jgi:hypothetical protein
MPAEIPVVAFDVALLSIGKLELPLNKHISRIAVRGSFEQDLETLPGFRSRHAVASELSSNCTHVDAIDYPEALSGLGAPGIDRGIDDDRREFRSHVTPSVSGPLSRCIDMPCRLRIS